MYLSVMPNARRSSPTNFRETAADKTRVAEMQASIGGSKPYVYRLALAHFTRKVRAMLAAGPSGLEEVKAMIAPDIVTILDPSLRGEPIAPQGRKPRAGKKLPRAAAAPPDAQPSAAR